MILDVQVGVGRPLGAYRIIAQLEMTTGRRVLPTSVYRSLGVLLERGLTTRIESRNASLANAQAMTTVASICLVCDQCGAVRAVEAPALAGVIAEEAATGGFRIGERVIEMQGICDRCQHSAIDSSKQLAKPLSRQPGVNLAADLKVGDGLIPPIVMPRILPTSARVARIGYRDIAWPQLLFAQTPPLDNKHVV